MGETTSVGDHQQAVATSVAPSPPDEKNSGTTTKISIDVYLIGVLTIPVVLVLSNREWLFPFGGSNSWMYFTYYFEYGARDPLLYWNHAAARLPWILKGMLIHRLLPPLPAHYTLHLSMLFAAVVIFYLIAKRLFDARIAFLATAAFATYSNFHSIPQVEWDYPFHDSAVNVLLTLLFLLMAARGERPRLALFLAGAAAASAIEYPNVLVQAPALAFWYLSLRRGPNVMNLRRSAAYFAGGGLAITAVYCAISFSLGGPLFYYWPQLREMLAGHDRTDWVPLGQVIWTSKEVQLPAAMAVVTAGLLTYLRLARRSPDYARSIVTCGGSFLLGMAGHVVAQLLGHPSLYGGLMVALVPLVFLAGAGLFAAFLECRHAAGGRSDNGVFMSCVVYGLFILPIVLWQYDLYGGTEKSIAWIACSIFLATTVLAAALGKRRSRTVDDVVMACTAYALYLAPLVLWRYTPDGGSVSWIAVILRRIFGPVLLHGTVNPVALSNFLPLAILAPFLVIAVPTLLASLVPRVRNVSVQRTAGAPLVVAFLSIANIVSTSIPFRTYSVGFPCTYLQGQFMATMDAYGALKALDPNFAAPLWWKTSDLAPGWSESCASVYGESEGEEHGGKHFPFFDLSGVYVSTSVARWRDGLRFQGGSTKDFSTLPKGHQWPSATPGLFRIAVLAGDPRDARRAQETLQNLGASVHRVGAYFIREGMISFEVTVLEAR